MKIRSNAPMPPRTRANVLALEAVVRDIRPPHRAPAIRFMELLGPAGLFEVLHCMRRWYSGQTMARRLALYRPELSMAMALCARDALGVYRGFKVPVGSELSQLRQGDRARLPVTRNHGFSSWSLTEAPTHRFSGGGRGKVGLVVRLVGGKDLTPVIAPVERTAPWFNALYEAAIGRSFRPTEGEYLIASPEVLVDVVRVKR